MKRSLKDMTGYIIETTDGKSGKVKDFLFDEHQWICRYLEADFGSLFSTEKVLIPRVFFKTPDWAHRSFPAELKTAELDKCPKVKTHMPVSRKFEEELHSYYDLNPYWVNAYVGSMGSYFPPRPLPVPDKDMDEEDMDTILRSFKEVEGYHIHALDGKIGHIDDLIVDDEDWQVVYAVVDTRNWLPWSKKVLIGIDWMKKISYLKREVEINLTTDTIKEAPEYNTAEVMDRHYEKDLYDFYTNSLVH